MLIFRQMPNCRQGRAKSKHCNHVPLISKRKQRKSNEACSVKSGSWGLDCPEAMLIDTETADLRFKRLARNSQLGGRTRRARDATVGFC